MTKTDNGSERMRVASATHASNGGLAASAEAVASLKADHPEVAPWLEEFEESASEDRNSATGETTIEEEIFYAAYLEATEGEEMR